MPTYTNSDSLPHKTKLIEKVKSTLDKAALKLDRADKRIGIALSGGADSVALLSVCLEMGWEVDALHCNFHLRGEESDRDQRFVTELCGRLGVGLSTISFNVASRMANTNESVEMACRELRYEWFAEMARKLHLDYIAIGHHRDDNAETFLLNALRGCGIAGVKGIPFQRGIYIRPLLDVSHQEILAYLEESGLPHVTDSTNAENEYGRNKIRNMILPEIEEHFPGGSRLIAKTARILSDQHRLLISLLKEKREKYVDRDGRIFVARLLENEDPDVVSSLLYHLLDGELEADRIDRLIACAGNSGKIYAGRDGNEYLFDRGILSLLPDNRQSDRETFTYEFPTLTINALKATPYRIDTGVDGMTIEARIVTRNEFKPLRDPSYAWFDTTLLSCGTIRFRHSVRGDRIEPFGMKGSTLVSDIFSDNKLSFNDKKKQLVMTAEDMIIWIPGLRNSRHFPVTVSTENILELHMLNVAKKS